MDLKKQTTYVDANCVDTYYRTWLCPTEGDFARTIETYHATTRARMVLTGGTGLMLLGLVPKVGWIPLLLAVAVGTVLIVVDRHVRMAARAEWALALNYVCAGVMIALGVAITGGGQSPMLAMCAMPLLLLANRFRRTVTLWGLGFALLMLAVAGCAPGIEAVLRDPTPMIFTAVLMISVTVMTLPHYDLERGLRATTHVDHLTGLLNRTSLDERFRDACAVSTAAGRPLSLIVFDLDEFKLVNDTHGHDVGDHVLRQVADVLMSHAREHDHIFRLGGEEIGVLMPATDLSQAAAVAQRQLRAVGARPLAGVPVTVSGGVASTHPGEARWLDLYRAADQALLRAKHRGRGRVEAADACPQAAVPKAAAS